VTYVCHTLVVLTGAQGLLNNLAQTTNTEQEMLNVTMQEFLQNQCLYLFVRQEIFAL
jgi:hypothetical protein